MNINLRYSPREWQKICHLEKARFSVYAVHRRAGKSELGIAELVDKAIKSEKELSMFSYIAPFLRQAKAVAWSRLKTWVEPLRRAGAVEINEGELFIRFKHNQAVIRIFGSDNAEALRGLRLDGAVLDEVSNIRPETWQDVVQPCLSDRLGWCIFIGTPSGINLFSQLYYNALELDDWTTKRFTVYDTQSIHPNEVERLRRDMSESSFCKGIFMRLLSCR